MKETALGASEFKAKCLELLDHVSESGQSILITKRGRLVARLTPVGPVAKPLGGSWKGRVKIKGDIVQFSVADEWESAR